MINKRSLDVFKKFRIIGKNKQAIADSFPIVFANLLTTVQIEVGGVYRLNLNFTHEQFYKFTNEMKSIIQNNNFDYLDNIILDLLKSYHIQFAGYVISIQLDPVIERRFINICNQFKGLEWNDVLEDFIDILYELLSHATCNNTKLFLG